jgi:hypothetical protein
MKSWISAGWCTGVLTGALALFYSVGCGGGTTQYDYEFSGTDCATGKQVFTSLTAMCTSLQSDSFNSSCALAARQSFFASHCTGIFQQSP